MRNKDIFLTSFCQEDYMSNVKRRVDLLHNNPALHARFDNGHKAWSEEEPEGKPEVSCASDGSTELAPMPEIEFPEVLSVSAMPRS